MGCSVNKQVEFLKKEQEHMRKLVEDLSAKLAEHESCHKSCTQEESSELEEMFSSNLNFTFESAIDILSMRQKADSFRVSQEIKFEVEDESREISPIGNKNISSFFQFLSTRIYAKIEDALFNILEFSQFENFKGSDEERALNQALHYIKLFNLHKKRNNVLLKLILDYKPKNKSISQQVLYKLLENMLDRKYESDAKMISEKKQPLPFPEFLIEFLNIRFGTNNVAFDNLKQIVHILVSNDSNMYLALFARLLHLKEDHVPDHCAVFLTKIRMDFNRLADTLQRQQGRVSTSSLRQHGRSIPMSEALALVYSLLPSDKYVRTISLFNLRPNDLSPWKFLVLIFLFRMSKLGITPKIAVQNIDTSNKQQIKLQAFVDYLENALDLGLTTDHLDILYKKFDHKKSGHLDRKAILSVMNLQFYFELIKDVSVSRAVFLNALLSVYNNLRYISLAHSIMIYDQKKDLVVDMESFISLILTIDPDVSQSKIKMIEKDILDNNIELNQRNFSFIMLAHDIGLKNLQDFEVKQLKVASKVSILADEDWLVKKTSSMILK